MIIVVNNQLDTQFIFLYLFIPILYVFRGTKCSSSGESIPSLQTLVYVGDRGMLVNLHTTVTYIE